MAISVWILGDQLIEDHPGILWARNKYDQDEVKILMIESNHLIERLPYHRKKLVLVLSAMRHYAQKLESSGYQVDYRQSDNFSEGISQHLADFAPDALIMMEATNYSGRQFQKKISKEFSTQTHILPNEQFLITKVLIPDLTDSGKTIHQEYFYRMMRRQLNILMDEDGQPVGGNWNYDKKNRQPLPKDIVLTEVKSYFQDPITQEVIQEVHERKLGMGSIDGFDLAVNREGALEALENFINCRLHNFGTYEDAMREAESILFHSKLSPYLNIGLLNPLELVRAAEASYNRGDSEINNVEGFIRQVIGWREFMRWKYQQLMPEIAKANFWGAYRSLPSIFWSGCTDLNCLKQVILRILDTGYAHHIERLMILSNFFLLTGIQPSAVVEWFMSVFVDAYDWVMIPNVVGMGLYADGGQVGTKPYIASANYINRMGDFCRHCIYAHQKRTGQDACPFNFLYWNFLLVNQAALKKNYRMSRMIHNLKYLDSYEQNAVCDQAEAFIDSLF